MRFLRKTFRALMVLLLLALVAIGVYVWRTLPQLDGEMKLPGLKAPVQVQRDASDVTHIRAQNRADLMRALGYTHAQERGWQLEFNRRIMHGTLSELFGPDTLETDKLLRTLGIIHTARQQLANMPPEVRTMLQAYSDGVNAYHQHSGRALAPEFLILNTRAGTWTPEDSVGWSIMMALDLGDNWGREFARLQIAQKLPTERMWQLLPPYPGDAPGSAVDFARLYADLKIYAAPDVKLANSAETPVKTAKSAIKNIASFGFWPPVLPRIDAPTQVAGGNFTQHIGVGDGKGSNNWVVAGSHSTSGKPIVANDPHLGLSAPAIWYYAHLSVSGQGGEKPLDIIGATLPGLPAVVLGRTQGVAWGFTNTGPDVQDLYIEKINPDNPNQYQTPTGWATFDTRTERIPVKGQPDVTHTVRNTRHGPVISDAQASHAKLIDLKRHVLSLRWSALDADNQTLVASLKIAEAQTVPELIAAFESHHAPMQNVVMADTSGRVAYQAVGRAVIRQADNDIKGIAPAPGWDAKYDWVGYLPYAQNPQADDATIAAQGWHATANQRITAPGYAPQITYDWTEPDRYDRIAQLLQATPKHDAASMARIQADVLSLPAQRMLPTFKAVQSSHPQFPAIKPHIDTFDGHMKADAAVPLVYAVWVDELTRGLLTPRLGDDLFTSLYGKRLYQPTIEAILKTQDAWWCSPKSCTEVANAAMNRALDRVVTLQGSDAKQWNWGRAHASSSGHKPFTNVGALARIFDVRSPVGGDAFTVNVSRHWPNEKKDPWATRHAASLRAIYDLADLEKSQFVYQTGQSGNPFSDRYRDMANRWAGVQYRPLQMKPATYTHNATLAP